MTAGVEETLLTRENRAIDVLLHEWGHALAWNHLLDRLAESPDTSPEEFEQASHDEAGNRPRRSEGAAPAPAGGPRPKATVSRSWRRFAAGAFLTCAIGAAARGDFDWTQAEAIAPGVSLGRMALTIPARPGLTCPQSADFDPAAPRPVAIACARVDLTRRGLSFEATPRAEGWGRPMPPHGDTEFPGMVIRTALQTVPAFAAAERAAGVPVVLAVNASPWEPFVPGKAFAHADRLGLVVDDGVVVSPPAAGRPSLLIRRDGSAEMRVVGADDDLADVETAVSGFSFCLVDGKPAPPDDVLHPRTGFGLSADRRVLFILVADGRQAASKGLTVHEVGALLRDLGADDGINMDGGGSTTLVAGAEPRLVNRPSGGLRRNGANLAIAVAGDER